MAPEQEEAGRSAGPRNALIGTVLDNRYRLERLLGEGGMGAVYEAVHLGTGRHVAVKVIHQLARNDTGAFARFEREAKASGRIDTRHIVDVLDSGIDRKLGVPFMAMSMLRGEDLGAFLTRRGALPVSLALRIVAQAVAGLARAHAASVVHRDIKPANLFLSIEEDDEVLVKLLDFGIAKVRPRTPLEGDGARLTQTGRLLGTPLYMSPEQAEGEKDIDHRSDIWSIGAVLYEALTGQPPHNEAEHIGKLILAICHKIPAPPSSLAPAIPPEVDAIVAQALTIDRERRWQSAAALLDALAPLLPDGSAIALEELAVGAPPAQRLAVTARGKRAPGPGATERMVIGSQGRVVIHDEASVEEVGAASTLYASGATVLPAARARRRRWGFAAAGALALAGGATVYFFGAGATSRSVSPTAPAFAAESSAATNDTSPDDGASAAPNADQPASIASASPPPSPSAPANAVSASAQPNGHSAASSARTGRPSAASATPSAARTVEIDTNWPK